jgi:hypothetical protein
LYWTGGIFQDLHIADNNHKYYNIADKEIIDIEYQQTGNADFYGIDQELEYIILPRNSHFDQEEAVRKTYYCVGNTVVDECIIDLSKEIELNNPFFLGQSQYFENEPNNLCWLKSNGQWNAKAVYPGMYEYILQNVKSSVKDFVRINDEHDDYCFIIDEENETFRLPLLNGSEDLPSDKYDNLTLEASDTRYTAPANGYFSVCKAATGIGQYIQLVTSSKITEANFSSTSSDWVRAWVPVKKGHVCVPQYTLGGETISFEFIYARGNGSLYYFVGETIQNANIIDAGKIQADLANKLDLSAIRYDRTTSTLYIGAV